MSTKEVSKFLNVNEKMVYTLVSEKGLPATKITGKWLFPQHLVEQWVEANTINFPKRDVGAVPYKGLLVIAGSNDLLLDRAITLFNTMTTDHLAVFGNLGSMGGAAGAASGSLPSGGQPSAPGRRERVQFRLRVGGAGESARRGKFLPA